MGQGPHASGTLTPPIQPSVRSTPTPSTVPSSEFVHAGGARSGAGSELSASRKLIFRPTRGLSNNGEDQPATSSALVLLGSFDGRARPRDPHPRRVDRVEPREQNVAE